MWSRIVHRLQKAAIWARFLRNLYLRKRRTRLKNNTYPDMVQLMRNEPLLATMAKGGMV